MFLRYELSQHMMEITLLKTPATTLWILWAVSVFCGVISGLYFRDCWGLAGIFFLYSLLSMACFYTTYAMLDVQLDQRTPIVVRSVRVTGKEIKPYRRTPHGTLILDAGGESDMPGEYTGSWKIYEELKVGASICFSEYPGALGATWRKVAVCHKESLSGGR